MLLYWVLKLYIKTVKCSVTGPVVAQSVGRSTALLFHDHGTRRGCVVSSTPWPYFTPGNTQYPLYRRLGGPHGQSGRAENLVPLGFNPQTIQPIVSCYTDWATRPTKLYIRYMKKFAALLRCFVTRIVIEQNTFYFANGLLWQSLLCLLLFCS